MHRELILGLGKYDHCESDNRGAETLGSILRVLGPRDLKNCQNLKVIFRDFFIKIYHMEHEESENRGHETIGSILRPQGTLKNVQNF